MSRVEGDVAARGATLAVAVAFVALLALAGSGVGAVWSAWSSRSDAAAVRRRLACLERQLVTRLPRGAPVTIDEGDEGEYQRLAEFVSSRGRVVAAPAARFAVSLVPAGTGSPCDILSVRVTRR